MTMHATVIKRDCVTIVLYAEGGILYREAFQSVSNSKIYESLI